MSTMYRHWEDLMKPKQLEVEDKTLTSTYGKFFAEPFERGSATADDGFLTSLVGPYASPRRRRETKAQ